MTWPSSSPGLKGNSLSSTSRHSRSLASIAMATLLWSLTGVVLRSVQVAIPWAVLIRSLAGGLVLLPFVIRGEKITPVRWLIVACVSFSAFIGAFAAGTMLANAALAVAMQYASPLYIFLWQLIVHRGRMKQDPLPMIFVLAGVIFLVADALANVALPGLLFSFLCGVFFAIYTVSLNKLKTGSPVGVASICNLSAASLALVILPFNFRPVPRLNPDIWLLVLAGLLITALSYSLYSSALKQVKPPQALMIALIEPILNPFWVFLVTGERISAVSALGLAAIVVGVLTSVIRRPAFSSLERTGSTHDNHA
ncbi:MAG TPA: hypothetical protein DCM45_07500 [Clostridiales bacterium]|nr:hypothetical protein [Clostridiales bacterium]